MTDLDARDTLTTFQASTSREPLSTSLRDYMLSFVVSITDTSSYIFCYIFCPISDPLSTVVRVMT
jgi:hypothetical protein